MNPLVRLSGAAAAALFLLFVFSSAHKVLAADFVVDSLADTPDASSGNGACADSLGACTLRAAIQEANALAGDDTIYFTATGTINLTAALPDLSSNITITGPGTNVLTVRRDTGGDYRILTVNSVSVAVSGVTLTNGKTADGVAGNFGGRGGDGGGILNFGTLTLTNVVVTANSTGRGGDGITGNGSGGFGGGIYNAGTLTMADCVVSQNTGGRVGQGGSFNTPGGSGGGIYHDSGAMTLTNVTVSDNHAGDDGNTGTSSNS